MEQNTFHSQNNLAFNPPPQTFSLSITRKLVQTYKLWHEFLAKFPKHSKHTLGTKIDLLFLETIEFIVGANYTDKIEKIISLKRASVKLDLLKFFLQISWEVKSLDNKKYISLSEKLNEIGRMLGGWIKSIK